MDKVFRQARLCALLKEEPGCHTVDTLAARLSVTARTIHRDLAELRLRGAAVVREGARLRLACPESAKELGQPAPPATEREVRWLALLKHVYEEPGSFTPGGLSQIGARRFEISPRTVFRDLDSLRERGLIEVRDGRCYPGRSFLPKLSLTADQVLALLSHLAIQGQLLPRGEALRRAEEKLRSCVLGEAGRIAAGRAGTNSSTLLVKGRYYLQPPEIEERVDLLEEACRVRRRVAFSYTALGGRTGRRLAEPLGLVYYWFHDAWYLVARADEEEQGGGGIRHFRLDRMGEVELTEEEFTPPEGFDLAEHMAPCWGVEHGELHQVRIRFYDEYNVLARLRRETAHRRRARLIEEPGGGSVLYTDEVAGLHEIRVWVRSFGSSAEVLEPAELRREVVESVQRIIQRYAGGTAACPAVFGLAVDGEGAVG